jgi:integrase/recombinase XerD
MDAMSPLRKQMTDAMRMRGFSVHTHSAYLLAVTQLARYYHRCPSTLTVQELQAYFEHLVLKRELSAASCRLYFNAIRFVYVQVLHWPSFRVEFALPTKPQRIPELLTRAEVGRILAQCANPKHHALLSTCYGCGLRVSELVSLRVGNIDGERQLLRVEQGKGAKDRMVLVSDGLLRELRAYWRLKRPSPWLFPGSRAGSALSVGSAQHVFSGAKARAEVDKSGGIHSLRHAYATHQLEDGLPMHILQRLLGHRSINTTMRYAHWVPSYFDAGHQHQDLIAALGSTP